ncbi:MAG: methyltransferase [Steroidobacteraceae bacterium]|jgi:demethylspheroidene O-methyltransferase|nr:methyltransferase [Steroidobacteraceae bacterium]
MSAAAVSGGWLDAPRRLRDRLLASEGFRHWAAGFPLTRALARRRARRLFDLCAGFVYSQVLLACVRLDLFEALRGGPLEAAALAPRLGLDVAACERLLKAAAALELVESRARGRWGLGPFGAVLVGNEAVRAMVEHHALVYVDLRDPVALLRGESTATGLERYWAYAADAPLDGLAGERVVDYTRLMSSSQPLVAADVLDAYPLGRHACLLDAGGGDGTFLRACARRAPALRLVLFDLPPVAARARAAFEQAGLGARATAVGGDFFRDPWPRGADVVSLVRVVHDHDDAAVALLLRRAREALPPGGTLLLAEPFAGTPGAETVGDAYFGFYLLAMGRHRAGRARTVRELREMLGRAGFVDVREVPTRQPLQTGLLVARTPEQELDDRR